MMNAKTWMDRRQFAASALALGFGGLSGRSARADAVDAMSPVLPDAGAARLPPWRKGELQVHFIYAGSSESAFYIFPDGTTMLVDCGDYDCGGDWSMRNPVESLGGRGPGKFTADYVRRVNPSGDKVDYWLLTHWHADHGGCETSYAAREERDGEVWFRSGLAELVDDITFGRGLDRCWPNRDDPFPCKDTSARQFSHIARTYRWLERHRGLKIEKFRVGADDQIRPLKDPAACPGFRVLNLCGNGIIRTRNGGTRNLYADFVPRSDADVWRRENGLSCGFLLHDGAFSLFAAGDFQDFWQKPDGTTFQTEDALAAEIGRVDVAKTNHHASDAMTPALVKALAARVWVTSSVSGYSDWPTTMRRLSDRATYAGDRLICSTFYHLKARVAEMGEAAAKADVAPESFEPNHVVVTVPPGGRTYTVTHLAPDLSLAVRTVRTFAASADC